MNAFMKLLISSVCLIGLFSLGGCASAPTKRPATVEALFKRADANGDGRVSRDEFVDFMIEDVFVRYDKNGDMLVTEKEYLANGGTSELFRSANVSRTGKVTLAEAKASKALRKQMGVPFAEADVNGDGYVTWAEFQAARAKARAYVR